MEEVSIITKIKKHALNRVGKYLSGLSIREQQILINHVIRYYDQLYYLSSNKLKRKSDEILNFIDFSFPIIFRYLYMDYSDVQGCPLVPSLSKSIESVRTLLDICFTAGLMENYEELLQSGVLKYEVTGEKSAFLSYKNKYFSIMRAFEGEYSKAFFRLLHIIKKMEKLVYTWNNNFIGYEADPEIDSFYISNALLDFSQATEWDGFTLTSKFGGIEYHFYLSALIAIESICIKHLQFVQVAIKKDPNLEIFNILPCIVDYIDLVDSLSSILNVSQESAKIILSVFTIDEEKRKYYNHISAPNPPFIKILSTQLLRSYSGCIYRPIEFMLAELKRLYSKDWDRNVNEREQLFRDELYKYFIDSRFTTFNRNIDIIEAGERITDIDACIVDKVTKDIAFIQLKWQDSIYESTRSLMSKRKNYIEKATKWVNDIELWINKTPEKRIADFLQLSPQFVCKDKIKIFVIGRHNGNYSGDERPCCNAAWCQWYNLIKIIGTCSKQNITIPQLFDLLQKESPYNQKNEIEPLEIKYGNYSIKLAAPPYNQA